MLPHPSITLLDNRDAKTLLITTFKINKGCAQEAADHLVGLLKEGLGITLNNEFKADGFTEFKMEDGSIYSRTSGHGSLGSWGELSIQDASKKIRMLAQFNQGDSAHRTGSIERVN